MCKFEVKLWGQQLHETESSESKCCAGGMFHRGVVLQTMNIRLPANQKEASKYMANDGIDYCYKQEV